MIGADNITLDLNGHTPHTIDGDSRRVDSCPEGEDCDVGMLNRTGYNGLTVVGGTIRQFGVGILIHGGTPHPV